VNVTHRKLEKYTVTTFTAILSHVSLAKQDKHDDAQLKESVLPYLSDTNTVTTLETGSTLPQKIMRKNLGLDSIKLTH
jgi:hypothetical protein